MKDILKYREKVFDEEGNEYWKARELLSFLEYSKWENFHKVIKQAMIACKASNYDVLDQFPKVRKPIIGGKGNIQYAVDYKLSRYACYLIVQNASPKKESLINNDSLVVWDRYYFFHIFDLDQR